MSREDELISKGWERRFIACEPRLSEMVDTYVEIGLEVHLEPLPDIDKSEATDSSCAERGCTVCYDADRERYKIIFTRPSK